jgi:hypothetical protein
MKDEFWGAFSIYDHRTPLFRQSLVFFDKIVVPVPEKPVGKLEAAEIDQLSKDVEFLEQRGAAKKFVWSPEDFAEWKSETEMAEGSGQDKAAVARRLVNDPPYLTRLMLSERTNRAIAKLLPDDVISVTAVPVYGSRDKYERSAEELKADVAERLTVEVLLPEMPVPGPDATFDHILSLRDKPAFQTSLRALRGWQNKTLGEIVAKSKDMGVVDENSLRRAKDDFEKMIKRYNEAFKDARFKKIQTAVTSSIAFGGVMLALGGPVMATLGAVVSPLFSIRELMNPCWKDLQDKAFFPAGVVYEAKAVSK